MGYLLLLLLLVFGYRLSFLFPYRMYRGERLAVATVVGICGGSWLILLCAFILPFSSAILLAAGLMVGITVVLAWKRIGSGHGTPVSWDSPRRELVWILYSAAAIAFLGYVSYTHMLPVRGGAWYSVGSSWADLALHGTLASHFAANSRLSLEMPIYYGGKLSYPFLIDFLSGVFLKAGWSMQQALLIPSALLLISFAQLYFFLSMRLFNRISAAAISPLIFLFGGSFWGTISFWKDWRASGLGAWQFLTTASTDYAHIPEKSLHMYNVLLGALLPQRGMVVGVCAVLVLITLLFEARKSVSSFWWAVGSGGVLLGLLPFFHVHSFLVAVFVLAWLAVSESLQSKRWVTVSLGIMVVGGCLAVPQLWWQLGSSYHQHFGFWHFGWMKADNENVITFWLQNLGPLFVFLIGLPIFIWYWFKDWFYLQLYLPFLVIFLAANLYSFQPNIWDNTKFMYYTLLVVCLFAGYFLVWLTRSWWLALASTILLIAMLSTGALAMGHELPHSYVFMSQADLAFAEAVQRITPADARILTADRHNHPVPVVAGRNIPLGYRGWLWTYGIDYRPVERDVLAMYAGGSQTPALLKQYGISYVVIGYSELSDFKANEEYFRDTYSLVYSSDEWRMYKVN